MAIEIEQPFGDDANDLPIESYLIELQDSLREFIPGFTHTEPGADAGGDESTLLKRIASLEAMLQGPHAA
jgi:hypothetical protein